MRQLRYASLLVLLLAGCDQSPPPKDDATSHINERSEAGVAVEAVLRQEQTERLRRLSASSRVFQDAINGLLGDPVDERLNTAREAWGQLYRSFNEAVVVLACRASESPQLANLLQRVDLFPILPGYIDGLQQWPDSGIVNDVSLPLSRESLLSQQGISAQEEISVGFQVVGFLLFGEPDAPRMVAALRAVNEVPEGSPLAIDEQPENRRRTYLALASELLVEDLLILSANPEQVAAVGADCPVDALRRATERMIRVAGMDDRQSVAGEYYSQHARTIAMAGLQQALVPWLAQDSALRNWLVDRGVQTGLPAPLPAGEPDVLLLQQLHAGLSAGRSVLQ
ncbi:MAG: imelysin family protein [Alcanivoracaceae bacterium]|jgi:putative iron-regulated protein|nr:imelysin family protein [Alcanivoracaceae bacterium]